MNRPRAASGIYPMILMLFADSGRQGQAYGSRRRLSPPKGEHQPLAEPSPNMVKRELIWAR